MKSVLELLKKHDGTLWQVQADDTVFVALQALSAYGVGALMVMDAARLVGVFSERDYTRKIALQGRDSRQTRVSEIMTRELIMVAPRTGTRDCMALSGPQGRSSRPSPAGI